MAWLLTNFKVYYEILNNVARNSFPVVHFSKKVPREKFVEWPKYNVRLIPEQYERKLKQCFKLSYEQFYCKKLFSKPEPKCEATMAREEYLKARRFLTSRIKDTLKFVESESRSITSDLTSRLENSKVDRAIQLRRLFNETARKLDKLTSLDVSYGGWMRKEMLLLGDEIRRSLEALERTLAPSAKRAASLLKKLRGEVSSRAQLAERSVIACRKRDTPPVELARCLKEATKTLDRANEEARFKLEEIARFREAAVRAHERTAREVMAVNRKKATEFSDYLDKCIKLKKSQRIMRN